MRRNQSIREKLLKHRRLILLILCALVIFIIINRVWFYVMGAFAVIGAVWVIREYNKKEDEDGSQ